jgi:cell division protein FtsW (lipid II flippase)
MYALFFILMAIALLAAIKKWRKISVITFLINLLLIIITFIPHTIRHINISL